MLYEPINFSSLIDRFICVDVRYRPRHLDTYISFLEYEWMGANYHLSSTTPFA